ncbi:DUF748 domain-containing protein [uncultured Zoogloea sp.]|uniref:DUF748 domain-containing protein n=1 Tax=uncultured Zoogloea sp. TaxID=160237 RepID=UPI002630A39B|nr:DUF748 domain-containing protein [uncultured Zoogloea sp.]
MNARTGLGRGDGQNKKEADMEQQPKAARRPLKWALWGAGIVAVVGVAGFLVAPPLVKSIAEEKLSEQLHRKVTIEGISINPYALSAEVRGFKMLEPDGGATAVSFTSLYANVEAESLFRGGIVVQEVKLVEPAVNVVRLEGTRLNWSDVIDEILNKPDDGSKSLFSVHNIRIEKGRIDIDDRPVGQKHQIADLELGVPFVSNLPSQVETFVEPLLAMKVNGTPFEVRGKARPFSATRESVVDLKFDSFDLTRYLAYVPIDKPFRLPSARLSSDLQLSFAQPAGAAPSVTVKGGVGLDAVEVQHADGRPAIKLPSVKIGIDKLAPLAGELALGTVAIDKPEFVVGRDREGRISLLSLVPKPSAKPAEPVPTPADSKPAKPFGLSLGEFKLTGGRLDFSDALPAGTFSKTLQDIHVSLRKFQLAGGEPAALEFGFATPSGETLENKGSVALSPLKAEGTLELAGFDLVSPKPYIAAALPGGDVVSGKFDGKIAYDVVQEAGGEPKVKLKAESLVLKGVGVQLKGEKAPLLKLGALDVRDADVDLAARKVTVGEVSSKATRVALVRDKNGDFNAQKLAGAAPAAPAAARKPVAKPAPAAKAGPDWLVEVKRVALDDWGVRVEDRTLTPSVVLNAEPMSLKIDGLSTAKGSKAKLNLQAAINKRGKVGVGGTVGLTPLAGNLDLDLKAVDLAMLQPYVTEKVKIAITRGSVTSRGKLAFELPPGGAVRGGFKGNLTIGDFASVDKLNAADFLKWRSLYFGGVDVRLSPLAVNIDDIALTDFYTRLILNAQGGLNIREIAAQQAEEEKAAADAGSKGSGAPVVRPAPGVAVTKVAPPPEPPIPLSIKRITLQGGNIAYSDRFIKPNYDANLTGMGGKLVNLSSNPDVIAELDLRGKVDDSAPVEVIGRFNPFRQDKALDIRASVKDFELSSVSTYAGKYVGYGIEKGKLSANLNYKIVDRKLTATNQVFLDQLSFGDKVESPSALKLPVLLAVSLLKNSRGEIDLDLPIGGSLDDPQFSVGAIVVKVIVNLVTKAVTSPFALLGSMFGGNAEELAWLDFDPGFGRLPEGADTKLQSIAKVMNEKPGLKLDIAGRVDPIADRDGLRRAMLVGKVEALKVKDMAKSGESAGEDGRVRVSPEEYPALLTRVYKDEKFPKPRNMVGLTKDLPVAEMEKLIITNTTVADEDVRLLAQRRAQNVKNWLVAKGQVPAERIFVLAGREGDDGKQPKAKVSRTDFSLR